MKENFVKYAKVLKCKTEYVEEESNYLTFRLWEKGDKKRIYINDYKTRTIGYIDILTGDVVIENSHGNSETEIDYAIENFFSDYDISINEKEEPSAIMVVAVNRRDIKNPIEFIFFRISERQKKIIKSLGYNREGIRSRLTTTCLTADTCIQYLKRGTFLDIESEIKCIKEVLGNVEITVEAKQSDYEKYTRFMAKRTNN